MLIDQLFLGFPVLRNHHVAADDIVVVPALATAVVVIAVVMAWLRWCWHELVGDHPLR